MEGLTDASLPEGSKNAQGQNMQPCRTVLRALQTTADASHAALVVQQRQERNATGDYFPVQLVLKSHAPRSKACLSARWDHGRKERPEIRRALPHARHGWHAIVSSGQAREAHRVR